MRRTLAVIVALVLCLSSASASETSGFSVGQWIGAAHVDGSGTFTHCDAGTLFKTGTSLVLAERRDQSWTLSLKDERWRLPVAHTYPLRVRFDSGPWLDFQSSAVSSSDLEVSLPHDNTLLSLLRRGHSIQVTSGTFDHTYDLAGTSETMDRLSNCVAGKLASENAAHEAAAIGQQLLTIVGLTIAGVSLMPQQPLIAFVLLANWSYQEQGSSTPQTSTVASADGDTPRPWNLASPPFGTPACSSVRTEVPLSEEQGTYEVPVEINGVVALDFTVDSGASDVVIPSDVFSTLARAKTITPADMMDEKTVQYANGATGLQRSFRIHSLQVGQVTLEDVVGSVGTGDAIPLLGQSFLSRFSSWSMDNAGHALILAQEPCSPP